MALRNRRMPSYRLRMNGAAKKNRDDRSRLAKAGSTSHVVLVHEGGWAVKPSDGKQPISTHETKAEAVKAAKDVVRAKGGEILVQGRDGRFRESYVIGRVPFTKISAVEGITPTPEARNRAREFDRKELSAEERRRAIIEAYRPKD
jgi:Uncharacterized protein conserved in bacteria (DUF2188)